MTERIFDIAVIGGGTGGVQAARAACSMGRKVYLCEATDWIGGQLTSQAVPPDEHRWIEEQGATRSYMKYRASVREAYLNDPAASDQMTSQRVFCPGHSWVSRLAHDPRLAHRLLSESLQPYIENGDLTISLLTHCCEALVRDDRVEGVVVEDQTGRKELIRATFFLDATDTGEMLPLTGAEYRIGAESKSETGEPHAPDTACPEDQQPITWVAALALDPDRPMMSKPSQYDEWRTFTVKGKPLLGWEAWGAHGLTRFAMFDHTPGAYPQGLWSYRRIQYPPYFRDRREEITLMNWPQNDYIAGNIIDTPSAASHLENARELTHCCVYWLWEQGYPIRLADEVLGTRDGLAKAPYIRESRRIIARTTILEQEIASAWNEKPRRREDSIGVGHYHIDLHKTTKTGAMMFEEAQPFEIPLSAMIPVRIRNLIPASKNIGTTHLTGGCFRLHPVEWTVGEAAGYLAAFCMLHGTEPGRLAAETIRDFQKLLLEKGFQLHWDTV